MSQVQSFPPVALPDARVLVLGSMPGEMSLQAHQYYAHPRNAFWHIFGELLGASRDRPYEERLGVLTSCHIALWDVLASCVRKGSLDTAIEEATIVANDFASFFAAHPGIRHVFFNGAKAEQAFQRYVLPGLNRPELRYQRLPSTSPAHAGMNFERKLGLWRVVVEAARGN